MMVQVVGSLNLGLFWVMEVGEGMASVAGGLSFSIARRTLNSLGTKFFIENLIIGENGGRYCDWTNGFLNGGFIAVGKKFYFVIFFRRATSCDRYGEL